MNCKWLTQWTGSSGILEEGQFSGASRCTCPAVIQTNVFCSVIWGRLPGDARDWRSWRYPGRCPVALLSYYSTLWKDSLVCAFVCVWHSLICKPQHCLLSLHPMVIHCSLVGPNKQLHFQASMWSVTSWHNYSTNARGMNIPYNSQRSWRLKLILMVNVGIGSSIERGSRLTQVWSTESRHIRSICCENQ